MHEHISTLYTDTHINEICWSNFQNLYLILFMMTDRIDNRQCEFIDKDILILFFFNYKHEFPSTQYMSIAMPRLTE